MTGLLCAVMVATKCLLFHPKGTKLHDLHETGTMAMAAGHDGVISVKYGNWVYDFAVPRCQHHNSLIDLLQVEPEGTVGFWSCTKKDAARWVMNPMQRQHDDAAKAAAKSADHTAKLSPQDLANIKQFERDAAYFSGLVFPSAGESKIAPISVCSKDYDDPGPYPDIKDGCKRRK